MSSQLRWGQPTGLLSAQPAEAGTRFWGESRLPSPVLRWEGCDKLSSNAQAGDLRVSITRPPRQPEHPWDGGATWAVGGHLAKGCGEASATLCPSPLPLWREPSTAGRRRCPGHVLGTATLVVTLAVFLEFFYFSLSLFN